MNNSMKTTTTSKVQSHRKKAFTQLRDFISTWAIPIYICSTPCSDKVYTEIRSATNTRSLSPSRSFFAPALTLSLIQPASRAAASVKCEHNKEQQLVRCNNNNNMKSKPVDKVNVQWNDTYHGEVQCMLLLLLSLSLINDSARTQRIEMKEGRWG